MKLVIFDCDGVLVNSEALMVELEMAFLKEHGLEFTKADYLDQFMGIPVTDWYAKVAALLNEKNTQPVSEEFFEPLNQLIASKLKEELEPIDGVFELVRSMENPKCVASSSSIDSLNSKLSHTGLFNYFNPYIFSTEMVARGKPAPDLFLHAASVLDEWPNNCIVIEDSANGVLAAKRAGMQVIGFTGGSHCPPDHASSLRSKGADFIATEFSDLITLLN